MADIKRCDSCKKTSDGEGDTKGFEIDVVHQIRYRINNRRETMHVSHPGVDLCANCLLERIKDGSTITAGQNRAFGD